MGLPKLGASASRTLRGMMLLKICGPKNVRKSLATWRQSVVRSSYIFTEILSTPKLGSACDECASVYRAALKRLRAPDTRIESEPARSERLPAHSASANPRRADSPV